MTVSKDVVLNIITETKQAQKQMKDYLGFTEKQARSASLALFKQQIKDQAAAAKEAKKQAKKGADGWRQAFKIAAADVAVDFARSLGSISVDLAEQVAEARTEIVLLNRQTGIATDIIAGLGAAAKASGEQLSDYEDALQGLPERMLDVASGTGEAFEAFDALGVSADDGKGKLRDANEVFRDLVTRLQGVESTAERAALANLAFGDAGVKMMGAIGDTRLDVFIERAERFGTTVGPEAAAATRQWNQAMQDLSALTMRSASDLFDFFDVAQHLENFVLGLATLKATGEELLPVFSGLASISFRMRDALANDPFGVPDLLRETTDLIGGLSNVDDAVSESVSAFVEQRNAIAESAAATRDATDAWFEFVGPLPPTEKQLREIAKAQREAASAAQAQADATRQAADVMRSAQLSVMGESERLRAGYQDQLTALQELERQGADTAAVAKARVALQVQLEKELGDVRAEEVRKAKEEAEDAAKAQAKVAEERQRLIDAAREASIKADQAAQATLASTREQAQESARQTLDAFSDAAGSIRDAFGAVGDSIIEKAQGARNRMRSLSDQQDQLRQKARQAEDKDVKANLRLQARVLGAQKKTIKARVREHRKAMRKIFFAEKGAALTEIAINTAVAATVALRQLGPLAGAIAAGAIAITGATQAGIVASQRPPKLHTGGGVGAQYSDGPDERLVTMRQGERMLNQRAAERMGDEEIDRRNRDEPASPGILQVVLGGNVVEEVRMSALRGIQGINGSFSGQATMGLMSPYRA